MGWELPGRMVPECVGIPDQSNTVKRPSRPTQPTPAGDGQLLTMPGQCGIVVTVAPLVALITSHSSGAGGRNGSKVQAGITATTRLPPCQPIGHTAVGCVVTIPGGAAVRVARSTRLPPPFRSSTYRRVTIGNDPTSATPTAMRLSSGLTAKALAAFGPEGTEATSTVLPGGTTIRTVGMS